MYVPQTLSSAFIQKTLEDPIHSISFGQRAMAETTSVSAYKKTPLLSIWRMKQQSGRSKSSNILLWCSQMDQELSTWKIQNNLVELKQETSKIFPFWKMKL
jgi:hypothetical protein